VHSGALVLGGYASRGSLAQTQTRLETESAQRTSMHATTRDTHDDHQVGPRIARRAGRVSPSEGKEGAQHPLPDSVRDARAANLTQVPRPVTLAWQMPADHTVTVELVLPTPQGGPLDGNPFNDRVGSCAEFSGGEARRDNAMHALGHWSAVSAAGLPAATGGVAVAFPSGRVLRAGRGSAALRHAHAALRPARSRRCAGTRRPCPGAWTPSARDVQRSRPLSRPAGWRAP